MRRIRLTLQYDGTGYHGWQIQPNAITIQSTITEAIKRIIGEDVSVTAAGRTDAGVHALGQIAAFSTVSNLDIAVMLRALNAVIPDDIRVMDACDVPLDFHPRYDAKSKTYLYIIALGQVISPFISKYVWHMPYRLDFEAMTMAAEFFKGKHDFSAFRGSGCGAKTTVRTVSSLSLEIANSIDFMTCKLSGDFIIMNIEADAFLRHMVRNITGTIIEVGRGKINPQYINDIILSKNRRLAGVTAPAKGLFLKKVIY
jgi:tRNA pseudouridine38-40 synthase